MAKKKFIAYFLGQGDGCDYTIGCNREFLRLEATSVEEAKREVIQQLEDYGADDDESGTQIEEVSIFEIAAEIPFDLRAWVDAKQSSREKDEDELSEAEERSMLAKLKNKYEPKDDEETESEDDEEEAE